MVGGAAEKCCRITPTEKELAGLTVWHLDCGLTTEILSRNKHMRDTIGTLESEPAPRQAPDMNEAVETIRGKKVRFAYASGARPLNGYTIKRGIGVGGFGEVYFAISDSGKEVALKHIKRNLDIELRGVRQCLNLKHVNLISLWDICTTESGESWVVMEYVPGDSLRDAVERHPGGMPLEEVQRWFRSACAGVNYLHNNGIVHRDLKPGNIFYDADEDVVKIGDYGLSKFISCSRRSGQTESVGTFHYMAPEIGKGVYGKEIDIYALGVILYEMLCGRLPFDGETSQEIIMKHLTADVNLDPVPAAFRSVLFRALAKDPDERYHSIDEMIVDCPAGNGGQTYITSQPGSLGGANARPKPRSIPVAANSLAATPALEKETHYIGDDPEIVYGRIEPVLDAEIIDDKPGMKVLGVSLSAAKNEPIARAMVSTYHSAVDQWNRSKLGTTAKTCLLVVAALVLVTNSTWLLPLGLVFACVYLPYLVVRTWFSSSPKAKVAKPVKLSRRDFEYQMRQSLLARTTRERMGDLTGSLLTSAIVAMVFGLLTGTFFSQQPSVVGWSLGVWVTLTAIAASWSILVFGKVWEDSSGENLVRRFWMLAMGLLVALFSYGVGQGLELDYGPLKLASSTDILDPAWQANLVDAESGRPKLALFLIFFGGVFAALRWWRQADPTRKTRLSIWSVSLCWLAAILLSEAFQFPQIAGCLVVVAAAGATQLAAPWISQAQRRQIRLAAMGRA